MTARILVVDDVPANLRLLEAKLRAEYYEVAPASSGEEALLLAHAWCPDIILLDVMMPEMDGFEVCRRLKADPATLHIPILMVTALTEPTERLRGLEAGADDFISKPLDTEILLARLRALLRLKQVLDAWRLRAETAKELGFDDIATIAHEISGARLLLVGVEIDEIATISEALTVGGMLLWQAHDEAEAWEKVRTLHFDAILLGVPLPGGDALRLTSRLRASEEGRNIPILLLAEEDQRYAVLRGFSLGAWDHVRRPIDPPELRARLRNQLRRHRYQTLLREGLDRSLEMAVTDALTGLRNRFYIRRHLETLLRRGDTVAVLLIDVDRFKAINDTYGHAAGDIALREVAQRLSRQIRAADALARYGGEEFLLVIAQATEGEARAIAERLRATVAETPVMIAGTPRRVTISIGGALTSHPLPADRLIAAADAALYRAKERGRDRVEFATAADHCAIPA